LDYAGCVGATLDELLETSVRKAKQYVFDRLYGNCDYTIEPNLAVWLLSDDALALGSARMLKNAREGAALFPCPAGAKSNSQILCARPKRHNREQTRMDAGAYVSP
jgi:hypothetical protein